VSEERPRRYTAPVAPEAPSGYRQSRRGSKSAKFAKKAQRQHAVASLFDRTGRAVRKTVFVLAYVAGVAAVALIAVLLVVTAINTVARWSAERSAQRAATPAAQAERSKENLLVIGVDGDRAAGFLALRVDAKGKQVFGIAIPDGAFMDVPGQGFERIGEAFAAGPEIALSAVTNYLTVPFEDYIVVPKAVYADALTEQRVSEIPAASLQSDLTQEQMAALTKSLSAIDEKNVALVPMPVKPLKLGDQTYFEPQREEIADLLKSWWGVDATDQASAVRVIVYNGAGSPGIAGEAAQVLIRSGFRVVDTKNADNFDYETTKIVVRRGDAASGEDVREALGVGEVSVEPSSADAADVIVIIGKDYKSPADAEKGTS